jgi:hypothetical protein
MLNLVSQIKQKTKLILLKNMIGRHQQLLFMLL